MKRSISLMLLLACASDNIMAAGKRKSLSEEMKNFLDVFSSPLSLNELDDKVELSVELPENFPAHNTTVDIKDNRSFKVTIKENNNTLIINGLQQGSSLSINSSIQQHESTEENNTNSTKNSSNETFKSSTKSNTLQQLLLSRLDFKELSVEHDEESNSLIISIPKIIDPNTKSMKIAIPKRQKKEPLTTDHNSSIALK